MQVIPVHGKLLLENFRLELHWSGIKPAHLVYPVERSLHAAVCLAYGGDHPQLLVTGGCTDAHKALRDAWMLDVQSGKWREVS